MKPPLIPDTSCFCCLVARTLATITTPHQELMLIRNKLRKSGLQISFWADVANTCNLRRILNYGCQVLHYAGHADDNFLAFESSVETECGVAEPLEVWS